MAGVDGVDILDRPMNNGMMTLLFHPWIYFKKIKGMKVFIFFSFPFFFRFLMVFKYRMLLNCGMSFIIARFELNNCVNDSARAGDFYKI